MPDIVRIQDRIVARLATCGALDRQDRDAIRALNFETRHFDQSGYLVREGRTPERCAFLLDGFAFRQKLTADGHRAVVGLLLPGDFADLQHIFLRQADHDVQALTPVHAAEIQIADLQALALARPAVGKAMWIDSLIEGSIFREWLLNLGRRDSLARVAHLLCEIAIRLQAKGRAPEDSYVLPMTQEQLGDTLGLTAVHINRILKLLAGRGLIKRHKRNVAITDWSAIRALADFNERYLHFEQRETT